MTSDEARRHLDEHKAVNPVFIRGRYRYVVLQDGRVSVWKAVGKSGRRWTWECYYTAGNELCWRLLPAEVRARADYEVQEPRGLAS